MKVNFFSISMYSVPVLLSLGVLLVSAHSGHHDPLSKVLVLSFDGLRHDYLEMAANRKIDLPNFLYFRSGGSFVSQLMNVYPTSTNANHNSLLTGLYPESHGYVDNNFYDPQLKEYYDFENMSQIIDGKWANPNVEPIWLTNQLQGYNSYSFYWPTTSIVIKGKRISDSFGFDRYEEFPSIEFRFEVILDWFRKSEKNRLGLLYFPEPDKAGHKTGPGSDLVMKKLKMLDAGLGYLRDQLNKRKIHDFNILFWSDHGMTTYNLSIHNLFMTDIFDDDQLFFQRNYQYYPKKGKDIEFYNALKKASKHMPFNVYMRDEVPKEFHFSSNPRIPPVVIIENMAYHLLLNKSCAKDKTGIRGSHGYSTEESDMHPYFMAWGPRIKKNFHIPELHTVDMYNLICTLLSLHPAPNNGSMHRAQSLITEEEDEEAEGLLSITFFSYVILIGFALLVACVMSIGAIVHTVRYRYRRVYLRQPGTTSPNSAQLLLHEEEDSDL